MAKLDTMHPPKPLAAMAPMGTPAFAARPAVASPPSSSAPATAPATGSSYPSAANPRPTFPPAPAASHAKPSVAVPPVPAAAAAAAPGRVPLGSQGAELQGSSTDACAGVALGSGLALPATAAGGLQGDGAVEGGRRGCNTAWFEVLVLDCDGVMVDRERASCEALRRSILEVRV